MDLRAMIKKRSFSNGIRDKMKRGQRDKAEKESDTGGFQNKNQNKNKKGKFEFRLVKYEALPEYLKDNEYILDYYRSEWPLKEAFLSVFSWHNETLNIWTHLGGFFLFVALTVLSSMDFPELRALASGSSRNIQEPPMMMMMKIMKNISDNLTGLHVPQSSILNKADITGASDTIPRWPWFVFLVGSMGCLICSSFSHLLACHSQTFSLFFWRLDYAGISLMIVSSFFPPIYYAFFCNSLAKLFYLSSISILGILAIITLLAPSLTTARFRPFRTCLFLTMGFSGLIPTVHAIIINWGHPQIIVALAYEVTMAVLYAAGAGFYVSRIPERWKPGAFDLAGHSHQIFHLFVIAGALAHYAATLVLLDWRETLPTCKNTSSMFS